MNWWLITAFVLSFAVQGRGDILDDAASLQASLNIVLLDSVSDRWTTETSERLQQAVEDFARNVSKAEARAIWSAPFSVDSAESTATSAGDFRARLQHVAAIEMLANLESGSIEQAREWRTIIALPKYANAREGAVALQRLGGQSSHHKGVGELLIREYFLWQITRAREKSDELARLIASGQTNPPLLASRLKEIETLSRFPEVLYQKLDLPVPTAPPSRVAGLLANTGISFPQWQLEQESLFPNLLTADDVASRGRLVLKLLRLIPVEYQSGVRDGEVVIPIEYREAVDFAVQVRRNVAELIPVWRQTMAAALEAQNPRLTELLDSLEKSIRNKVPLPEISRLSSEISDLLQKEFGVNIKRAGMGGDVVTDASMEVRSLLGQSLASALAGRWSQAESLRLEAYVNFDLDIEMRVLPRDPSLALRAEKAFLDGDGAGIKAVLDARRPAAEIEAAYARAISLVEECVALCRVGLAPGAAIVSATLIVLREGLEAVVILAALLAGLRGPENAPIRHRIATGAWLALAASVGLFVISRTILSGFSRHGEVLEAIISMIAVAILLIVTNWVFHKYYWTGWNARLRQLSKSAVAPKAPWMESAALVGVGFMTIFREGFETTLFLQSLILEAGMGSALIGVAIGGSLITILGFAVFWLGAKLPYRKMLVLTGILVVFVLFTFAGSTVRILQTVGWIPIHPIPGLSFPPWMGLWLGLYPTFEGLFIPFLVFVYVGGAWLWVKFSSRTKNPEPCKEL